MSTEKEKLPIDERAEELTLPEKIERKEGVQAHPHHFQSNVKIKGKPATQTTQNSQVKIELPTTEDELNSWSKGKIEDARTWFASFFLRLLKKQKN